MGSNDPTTKPVDAPEELAEIIQEADQNVDKYEHLVNNWTRLHYGLGGGGAVLAAGAGVAELTSALPDNVGAGVVVVAAGLSAIVTFAQGATRREQALRSRAEWKSYRRRLTAFGSKMLRRKPKLQDTEGLEKWGLELEEGKSQFIEEAGKLDKFEYGDDD